LTQRFERIADERSPTDDHVGAASHSDDEWSRVTVYANCRRIDVDERAEPCTVAARAHRAEPTHDTRAGSVSLKRKRVVPKLDALTRLE
jgi:hypothetical protein